MRYFMIDDRLCRFIARNVNIEPRVVGIVEYDTAFFFYAKHAVDFVNQSNLWDNPNLEGTQAMQKLCLISESGFGNQSVTRSVNVGITTLGDTSLVEQVGTNCTRHPICEGACMLLMVTSDSPNLGG